MDLNVIKNKLQSMQTKKGTASQGEKKNIFWKPPVGKVNIRIVPSKFDKSNPFTELYFHYLNKTIISPKNFGEKDPIIEFASELRKSKDKENWRLAKKLDPKMRIFVPIVVRGEEDQGVKLWSFGKEVYMDFLNLAEDEDIGDFTDILTGRDMSINTVGPDVTGTKYNKSTVTARTKVTPLTEDKALLEKLLNEQPNPKEVFKRYTFDEIKTMLQEWLTPEEGSEGSEEISVGSNVKQTNKFENLFDEE